MRAAFPQALSIVLLAFIICGTTVEAAHNHGNIPGSNKVTGAAHFSDPATEGTLGTSLPGSGDCLICQLHQNFSATVLSVSPSLAPLIVTASFIQSHSVLASSQTSVTRTGRAPPKTPAKTARKVRPALLAASSVTESSTVGLEPIEISTGNDP